MVDFLFPIHYALCKSLLLPLFFKKTAAFIILHYLPISRQRYTQHLSRGIRVYSDLFLNAHSHIEILFTAKSSYLNSRKKPFLDAFVRVARTERELTWKALFVARWQKCGGWRDGRRRVPGGHNIRLHPVARRKLQDPLLLLAASPPTSARRERLHGRQKADPAHVFAPRLRFRAVSLPPTCVPDRPTSCSRDY